MNAPIMALRPPSLQRALPAFSLNCGVLVAPRLLRSPQVRFSTNDTRAPAPRPVHDPSRLSLDSFLGDNVLSRRSILRTSSGSDLMDIEFPVHIGGNTPGNLEENMFRLCVYSTKHNTHISYTKPNKDTILTMSCGNVGFKKANRGTFEAAYQLASTMFAKMEERGLKPKNLEIIYRDFGPGRDAFTKVLLGKEGKWIRGSVRRLTDSSRLKFGGTRSRAIRRL